MMLITLIADIIIGLLYTPAAADIYHASLRFRCLFISLLITLFSSPLHAALAAEIITLRHFRYIRERCHHAEHMRR